MGTLKIIREDREPGFDFERAWIVRDGNALLPRAQIGGVECNIESSQSLLAAGLAFCEPVDPDLAADWPMGVLIEKTRPDGSTYQETLQNVTTDPRVVAAARRYWELAEQGQLAAGKEL